MGYYNRPTTLPGRIKGGASTETGESKKVGTGHLVLRSMDGDVAPAVLIGPSSETNKVFPQRPVECAPSWKLAQATGLRSRCAETGAAAN